MQRFKRVDILVTSVLSNIRFFAVVVANLLATIFLIHPFLTTL